MWALLIAAAGPMVINALAAIGVGLITYASYSYLYDLLEDTVQTTFSGLPTDALAYASLIGFPEAFGIILAGYAVRVALVSIPRFGRLTQ